MVTRRAGKRNTKCVYVICQGDELTQEEIIQWSLAQNVSDIIYYLSTLLQVTMVDI